MTVAPDQSPSQDLRDRISAAIRANDIAGVAGLLESDPQLANADLRATEDRNVFSWGHPLCIACEHNFAEIAELLLKHGSDADAPGPNPDDRPVHGMPLHYAAAEHQNYPLANLLLDHGATPNSYPNCDKATIERMFYHARASGMSNEIVRRAFSGFLPDKSELEAGSVTDLAGADTADAIKLFARMVDLGAQTPFVTLVREGFHDLAIEAIDHSRDESGSPHDHPNSKVWNNVNGAARWYGYPELVRQLMNHDSYCYSYEDCISTIGTAIGSHNRDGDYQDYREIIVMQLEAVNANGDLEEAQEDPEFKPLYQVATDFTWHRNYGYRAAIAEPECYVDLAELLVEYGLDDIEHRDPENGHSPLSAAVARGSHPGIIVFIRWLLNRGAELRQSDPDEINPIAIARKKGYVEICELLESYQ